MSFIFDQCIFFGMGVFVSYSSKLFKMHPIPLSREIMGYIIGLGIVWLTHQVNADFYSMSFTEQCRFALLGYLPGRIIWRVNRK